MQIFPVAAASSALLVESGKKLIKTMIKSRLAKLKRRLRPKKPQTSQLRPVEEDSKDNLDNSRRLEEQQRTKLVVDDDECCCCCCCYGCDLDLVRAALETEPSVYYDENLANENLENLANLGKQLQLDFCC